MAIVDVSLPIIPISSGTTAPVGSDGSRLTINGSQTGGPLTDVFVGTTGNDVLDGQGGADIMSGTFGDDAYVVDNPGDLVVELPLQGTDTVFSSIDYTLPDNVENLVLQGTAGLTGTGNGGANIIVGTTAADTLIGGGGDDIFGVRNSGTSVQESAGGGVDTVYADVSFSLPENVENLVFQTAGDVVGVGNAADNTIAGGSGNDVLDGGAGNDSVSGADGNDVLSGGGGNDTLDGGAGADIAGFTGARAEYSVSQPGGPGTPFVVTDLVAGRDGTDALTGLESLRFSDGTFAAFGPTPFNDDLIFGGANDVVDALAGDDVVRAGDGDDSVNGNLGNDQLFGENGNDVLSGGAGNDSLDGGAGADIAGFTGARAEYSVSQPGGPGTPFVVTDLVAGRDGTDTLTGIESLRFSDGTFAAIGPTPFNDDLTFGNGDDVVDASTGDDTVRAGGGNDRVSGGAGNDNLSGGDGSDELSGGAGDDTLDGGADDSGAGGSGDIATFSGARADYTFERPGGPGTTIVVTDGVAGRDGRDILTGIESLRFSDGVFAAFGPTPFPDDLIYGDAADVVDALASDDVIRAEDGDDFVDGNSGNDRLFGGNGNDELHGESGLDSLEGEDGNDRLGGGDGNDRLAGGSGEDTLFGGTGEDTLFGDDGNDELSGENGQDVLEGGRGKDRLFGNDGDDVLRGNDGDDDLQGGDGQDRLEGGDGDDRLAGGANNDVLVGGSGSDTFVFEANFRSDRIEDFQAEDVIELSAGRFSSFSDVLQRVSQSGGDTVISDEGGQNLTLQGVSVASLQADDFRFV